LSGTEETLFKSDHLISNQWQIQSHHLNKNLIEFKYLLFRIELILAIFEM